MNAAPRTNDVAIMVAVILVGGVMGWLVLRRQFDSPTSSNKEPRDLIVKSAEKKTVTTRAATSRSVAIEPMPPSDPPPPLPRKGKPPIWDTGARAALKQVGANPEAERYWLSAINNPALPAIERQDLIEDLNEDGLSDPRHPGVIDLPLIEARIRLIEQLMPDAMDRVNAEAFKEAHKDLVKMRAKLDG